MEDRNRAGQNKTGQNKTSQNKTDQNNTDQIGADNAALIRAALEARKSAYVPYSHYAVGAALLTDEGEWAQRVSGYRHRRRDGRGGAGGVRLPLRHLPSGDAGVLPG